MNKKWLIVLVALLVAITLYWTRYQIVEVHHGNAFGFYKINRLTGKVIGILGTDSVEVRDIKETKETLHKEKSAVP